MSQLSSRLVRQRLTGAQLEVFLSANGLELNPYGVLLTPAGYPVGTYVTESGVVTIVEEVCQHGRYEVKAWWPNFRQAWVIIGGAGQAGGGPLLGPDEVICDSCNALIITRPVAVVGDWALCPDCLARSGLPFPGHVPPFVPGLRGAHQQSVPVPAERSIGA